MVKFHPKSGYTSVNVGFKRPHLSLKEEDGPFNLAFNADNAIEFVRS